MKKSTIYQFVSDESGATAIEYGLIGALVSVAAIIAMTALGGNLETLFTEVSGYLSNAANGAAASAP